MRHLRLLGLCLLAAFALGAVAATAAQAETTPEWGRCVKLGKNKGKYKNAACTELEGTTNSKGVFKAKAKGAYEWVAGADTLCYEEPGKKGKYKNNTCTELEGKTVKGVFKPEAKGKYEKAAGGPKFTGEGGTGVLLGHVEFCETATGKQERVPRKDCVEEGSNVRVRVSCTHEHATGEAVGSDEVADVHVLFTGCKLSGVLACQSAGKAPGEIEVNPLKGSLGYIDKEHKEVGVLLQPASGAKFVEFGCEEAEARFVVGAGSPSEGSYYEAGPPYETPGVPNGGDGIISPIVPVDSMTSTLTQEYKFNASDENLPTHFEGGPREGLELYDESTELEPEYFVSTRWGQAGEEIKNVNTLEGEAEIKA